MLSSSPPTCGLASGKGRSFCVHRLDAVLTCGTPVRFILTGSDHSGLVSSSFSVPRFLFVNAAPCRSISPFDAAELPVHLEAAITSMTAHVPNNPRAQKRVQDAVQSLKNEMQKAVEQAVKASLLGRWVSYLTMHSPAVKVASPFLHGV